MKGRFSKPTLDELRGYAREIGFRGFDAERFFDYYECCGWVVGRNKPMRDWRAAVRNWRRMDQERRGDPGGETDPEILEYMRQAKRIIEAGGFEIGRFWKKVRDAIGADGLDRVQRLSRK